MPSLRDLGEAEVLRRLEAERGAASGVALGPGDDGAVLEPTPGAQLVATTDAFVEGVHYLLDWSKPGERGARLVAANLSDLAAMAAIPRWALLSMGARSETSIDSLVEIQRGAQSALGRFGAGIVGGNLTSVVGAEWLSLTLLGEVTIGRALTRSGAAPDHLLAVTGSPGRAGAGWRLARRLAERARTSDWRPLVEAWLEPEARVTLALELSQTGGVSAAIDISDGFAAALSQLCQASGVGAEVSEATWPVDTHLDRASIELGVELEALRFGASDDYELVLAIDPSRRAACEAVATKLGAPLGFVGRFTEDRALTVMSASGAFHPLAARGYDAFGNPVA